MNVGLVCIMGIATVFIGLICLIGITMLMSAVCKNIGKKPVETATPIANKSELIAAICAVIAEENGTDVSNIRVTSFKEI